MRQVREPALTVLVVEGNPEDASRITDAVTAGLGPATQIDHASTLDAACRAIESRRPDCVLIDLTAPDADRLAGVSAWLELDPGLAVIGVTDQAIDARLGFDVVRAGAQDYVHKADLVPPVLARVIRYAVLRASFRRRMGRSRDVLVRAMENSPIGWSLVSPDGLFFEANPAFEKLLGRPRAELLGTRFDDYTHPEDQPEGQRVHDDLLEGRTSEKVREKRYLRPDGEVVWVLVHITAIRDDSGSELEYFLVQTQDITAKRQAAESRAQLAALVEASEDAIYTKDLDGVVTSWNRAATRFFGYSAEEMVGRSVEVLFPPELAHRPHENLDRARRGESVGPRETQLRRKDGTMLDLSVVVSSICDEQGRPIGASTILRDISEQKRQHLELQRGEDRYRRLIEAVHDGIWVFDRHGTTTLVNQRMADLLGYSLEELQARSLWDFVEADEGTAFTAIPATEQSRPHEVRLRRRDGGSVWVLMSRATLTDPAQGDVGSIVSVADITDRRRSETMFRTLLEQAPDAMVIVDCDGRIVLVNSEAEHLFGYARQELIGGDIEVLLPKRFRPDHVGLRHDYAGRPHQRDIGTGRRVYALRKDGTEFPAEISLSPLETETGTLISSSIRDVTARIAQEQELEERERRFRAVFDHAQDAMLIADDERRYVYANAAASRLLGRSVEELRTLRIEDVSPPELEATAAEQFQAFKRAGVASGDYVLVRPDGEERRVEFTATANILPGQHLSVLRDVTERVRAERERVALHAQLQQAQRLESVGKLAGGVAHDFNNLLSIILNYAQYASSRTQDDELREELSEIIEAADRAASLTRQLLIFSRRDLVNPEVIDVGAAVLHAVGLMKRTLGERIAVETDLPEEMMSIELDRGQLDQVLLNLAVNARDAMPDGGVLRFSLSLQPRGANANANANANGNGAERWVTLLVTDTGTGMDDEVKARAFEPFFSTKSRESGTGLGLATVYGIVTQSGGQISLHSTPGTGTTVEIRWPWADEEPDEPQPLEENDTRPARPRTVLVVEDEFSLRKLMARILTDHGYSVISAGNGDDALVQAQPNEIDLLITDVVMPGKQGPELAEALRARRPNLPVLYVSGYTEEAAELMSDGLLLPKPFTARQLLGAIDEALGSRAEEALR